MARHPQSQVLSSETGHQRDYSHSPYAGYFSQPDLMFPASPTSDRLPTKAPVLGVWTHGAARAYPLSAFDRETLDISDRLGGKNVTLAFNAEENTLRVAAADDGVHWMYSLWFAWYAFRPQTDVFHP